MRRISIIDFPPTFFSFSNLFYYFFDWEFQYFLSTHLKFSIFSTLFSSHKIICFYKNDKIASEMKKKSLLLEIFSGEIQIEI